MTRNNSGEGFFGMASLAISVGSGAARATVSPSLPPLRVVAEPQTPAADRQASSAGYAAAGANWIAIGLIGAAHAAVIAVLLTTGAIRISEAPPPVLISFVEEIAQPVVETPALEAAMETVPTDLFVPEVVIEAPVAPPPPVLTITAVAPPPNAVAAPANVKGNGDAPVVPPDFSADQLNNPGPRYPAASRRAHEEGTVMLKVLVAPDGRAQELSVATSSGFRRLDDAALATVKRWAFLPAKKAGQAVSAWVLVPVTFDLG